VKRGRKFQFPSKNYCSPILPSVFPVSFLSNVTDTSIVIVVASLIWECFHSSSWSPSSGNSKYQHLGVASFTIFIPSCVSRVPKKDEDKEKEKEMGKEK
jgi:hypothetical protein